jgi:hypothetical protein
MGPSDAIAGIAPVASGLAAAVVVDVPHRLSLRMLNNPQVTLTNQREYGRESTFRTLENLSTLVRSICAVPITASYDD